MFVLLHMTDNSNRQTWPEFENTKVFKSNCKKCECRFFSSSSLRVGQFGYSIDLKANRCCCQMYTEKEYNM